MGGQEFHLQGSATGHMTRNNELQLEQARRPVIAPPTLLRAIYLIDDLVHIAIAVLLLALSVAVIGHTVNDFITTSEPFALATIHAVNGVLFVVILMEILRTVVAHFTHGTFQLMPFITIGIISAVRHILTVGSALTMGEAIDDDKFDRLILELAVNTGVALGLVIALVMLRLVTNRSGGDADN
jgi:uncharacterized membrane protein (DUF373 family)